MVGRRADPVSDHYALSTDCRHLSRCDPSASGGAAASIRQGPIVEAPTDRVKAVVLEGEMKPGAERHLREIPAVPRNLHDERVLIVQTNAKAVMRVDHRPADLVESCCDLDDQSTDVTPRIVRASRNGDLALRRGEPETDLRARCRRDSDRNAVAMPGRPAIVPQQYS